MARTKRVPRTTPQAEGYLTSLTRRNAAVETVRKRRTQLAAFASWLEAERAKTLLEVEVDDIEAFLDTRAITSPASTRGWTATFRSFYEWAIDHELLTVSPMRRVKDPRMPRRVPRPIADKELHRILSIASRRRHDYMHAFLALAAYGGLRCCEIATIRGEDVDFDNGLLTVRGKGGHHRVIPMHPRIKQALGALLVPGRGPVFLTHTKKRNPITAGLVSSSINTYLTTFGIDATAHQLRHWFGTNVYRESQDLRLTQELMGHASPVTTAAYAAFDSTKTRGVIRSLRAKAGDSEVHATASG